MAGQLRRQRLQIFQVHVQPVDLQRRRASSPRRGSPRGPVGGPVSILWTVSRSGWLSAMGEPSRTLCSSRLAVVGQSSVDLVQAAAELVADHPGPRRNMKLVVGGGKLLARRPRSSLSVIRRSPTCRLSSAASGSSTARQLSLWPDCDRRRWRTGRCWTVSATSRSRSPSPTSSLTRMGHLASNGDLLVAATSMSHGRRVDASGILPRPAVRFMTSGRSVTFFLVPRQC